MRTAAIIPTLKGDSSTLRDALQALVFQTQRPSQVIVSIDSTTAPEPDVRQLTAVGIEAIVVRGMRSGPAVARNRALDAATGDLVLFLNDDTIPDPDCLAIHQEFHARSINPAIALGYAQWAFGREPLLVIDRLVAETSLVFFYDQMSNTYLDHDWGFRHAWTLNLSVPRSLCQPFDERLHYPMFEDLEWGYRCTYGGVPVHYIPEARVEHRHRPAYTPETLLRREALIGNQAHSLRRIAPKCFSAVFGSKPVFAQDVSQTQIDSAQRSYTALLEIANRTNKSINIANVFENCRPWREAARAIGWAEAEERKTTEQALDATCVALVPSLHIER